MGEETLLIVGNGFDLSMGFKTSYGDFMKSSYFPHEETSIRRRLPWRFWRTRMTGSCGSWKMASNGRSAKTCLQVPSRNSSSKPSKRGASRFLSPNAAIAPWACAALLHTTRRSPAQTRAYMRIFISNLPSGARALRENWQKRRSAGARNMGSRA